MAGASSETLSVTSRELHVFANLPAVMATVVNLSDYKLHQNDRLIDPVILIPQLCQ